MNERERRILTDLVDAVCELGAEVDSLENQLVIRTEERDGLARWQDEHMDAMCTSVDEMRRILGARGGETPEDAARRVIKSLDDVIEENKRLASENETGRSQKDEELIRHLDFKIAETRNILGVQEPEKMQDAARRVVTERDGLFEDRDRLVKECRSATKRLMEELKSVASILSGTYGNEDSAANEARKVMRHVAGLNKVADAALAVWKVYGRPVRTGYEEDRIARSNALDDAMGALDEVLNRGMDDQEGPDATDDGDMVAVDFVQCNCFNHASTPSELCVLALGHDGPHVFPSEVGEPGEVIDAEFVRCRFAKDFPQGARQCSGAEGHDGPHVFEPKSDGPPTLRCQYHDATEGSTKGRRCVRRLDHDHDHRF